MNGVDLVIRIDELLDRKKVSRAKMSEELGFPKNLIAQWKQRGTIPAADIVYKIAQYLNTTMEWLLTGKESNEYKIRCDELIESMQNIQESIQNAIDHYNNE